MLRLRTRLDLIDDGVTAGPLKLRRWCDNLVSRTIGGTSLGQSSRSKLVSPFAVDAHPGMVA
jgi:hypothetical protein